MTVALLAAVPQGVFAARAPSCETAALRASQSEDLPPYLLAAISRTETGHTRRGRGFGAWPWTLNIEGKGYYFDNKEDTLRALRAAINAGKTSVDVGCMQINYRWHGEGFASLEDMLDPDINARYAAHFLTALKDRHGSWDNAVRRYHSSKADLGNAYLQRVEKALAAFDQGGQKAPTAPVGATQVAQNSAVQPLAVSGDLAAYLGRLNLPEGNLPKMPDSRRSAILGQRQDSDIKLASAEDAAMRRAAVRAAFGMTD